MTQKEKDDYDLALKLRRDGIITTPGEPFEMSDDQEITSLISRGVFKFERYNPNEHGNIHIFNSRMVREVKGKTEKPFEKSRLIVQGHSDEEKRSILTQSPTIQRVSQRLLAAIAPGLDVMLGITIELRDVTQAYPQSKTLLQRDVFARLPKELVHRYPPNTIMKVILPLYGLAESGVHWWTTYHQHHQERLGMQTSTFDPCLLVSNGTAESFGMVGMQTDDTLILATPEFSAMEDEKIRQANFRCKPKLILSPTQHLDFNGTKLTMDDNRMITVQQKGQSNKINTIDATLPDYPQKQRARGAYLASICQPEATFDLSTAAQTQNQPNQEDCAKVNKRLNWQKKNPTRGLRYIPLDLKTARLIVFVDSSFANNRDFSSQIGFVVTLANEEANANASQFKIHGNILHWSSTKCKRVTRSVLASEIYGMVDGFDIGIVLSSTLQLITDQLDCPRIPLVICTDSYSLYECLVKLGTTKEKRLMIDIMSLRQAYERREINEIRWINGDDNPADAMTKTAPNKALERLIDNNELTIRVEGYVDR